MTPARISLGVSVTRAIRALAGQSGTSSIVSSRRPPRVIDDPQAAVGIAAVGEQRRDLGPERLLVEAEMDRGGGAAEAGEVVVEPERVAAVELDHLEGAVAAQQPVVEDRDRRLLGRQDLAVDAGQDGCSPCRDDSATVVGPQVFNLR